MRKLRPTLDIARCAEIRYRSTDISMREPGYLTAIIEGAISEAVKRDRAAQRRVDLKALRATMANAKRKGSGGALYVSGLELAIKALSKRGKAK